MINDSRPTSQTIPLHRIMLRLLLPMLVEATRMIEDQSVVHVSDIDRALVGGIDFPRDGLLKWADALGPKYILEQLELHQSLGNRFQPNALLREMARYGRRFYQ
jgi:3-hydroxyacyl-CoA dehydrogenase